MSPTIIWRASISAATSAQLIARKRRYRYFGKMFVFSYGSYFCRVETAHRDAILQSGYGYLLRWK
jgi:hypothetical protein